MPTAAANLSPLAWRSSSHSLQNGACIELARDLHLVRDSKNPSGPVLTVDLGAFVTAIKVGRITHQRSYDPTNGWTVRRP